MDEPCSVSPLYATVMQRTRRLYPLYAGGAELTDLLGTALCLEQTLRARDVGALRLPLVCTHGRLTADNVLLKSRACVPPQWV